MTDTTNKAQDMKTNVLKDVDASATKSSTPTATAAPKDASSVKAEIKP